MNKEVEENNDLKLFYDNVPFQENTISKDMVKNIKFMPSIVKNDNTNKYKIISIDIGLEK